jgi:hypothetical protein
LILVSACSGGAPYDIPQDPVGGGAQNADPGGSTPTKGESPPPPSAPDAGAADATTTADAAAGQPKDAAAQDATIDAKDAKDAAKESGPTTCTHASDCPNMQACMTDKTPAVCSTNGDCSSSAACNGGCCNFGSFFGPSTCSSGYDDYACGMPGEVCQDCTASGRSCMFGKCE